ncbi:MAG: heavy metal translocating P-type ATPase [Thermomicrobiales bacterium]
MASTPHISAISTLHDPEFDVSPPRSQAVSAWLDRWALVISAVGAWLFTLTAIVLDHFTSTPQIVIVPLFIVAYISGGTLATRAAIGDLLDRRVNVDLLMVTAAIGAAIIGAWAEGAILLALFSSSNALEHFALERTRNAVRALMELAPAEATRLDGERQEVVAVTDLQLDDIILIRPGEKVAADAMVIEGQSGFDQAAITGESVPVMKEPGDTLFAGTLNGQGAIRARVTALASESTLAKIVRLVEEAQAQKSRAERFADAFEGPYAIGVLTISALVAIVPMLFGADPASAFYRAMTLLVVASPCALVISTPAATLSALANSARNGVLVKGGSSMDVLGSIDIVAFDKTGTLTIGKPQLTDVVITDHRMTEHELLAIVASAEQLSEHLLANALVESALSRNLVLVETSDLVATSGEGIRAVVAGRPIAIGNERLFTRDGHTIPDTVRDAMTRLRTEGKTVMLAGDDGGIIGIVAVADRVRPEAREVIRALKRMGIKRTIMLTGDSEEVARAIAREIGLDDVRANLLPEHKLDAIRELQRDGKVAMIGDGVNDAPALATAELGIAMGAGGTDVALETADIVLMGDELVKLPFAINLSRRMRKTIRINIAFALSVIAVLITTTLTVGIPLPLGVVGHEGSTIIVVLFSLRLLSNRSGKMPSNVEQPVRDITPAYRTA